VLKVADGWCKCSICATTQGEDTCAAAFPALVRPAEQKEASAAAVSGRLQYNSSTMLRPCQSCAPTQEASACHHKADSRQMLIMAKKQHRRVAQPTAATLHRPNIPSPRLAAVALVSCCEQQHWQRLLHHQRAAACCLYVSFIAACCWRLGARVEAAAAEQADTLHKHTAVRTSINACAQSNDRTGCWKVKHWQL
jgi:hypothetical protein